MRLLRLFHALPPLAAVAALGACAYAVPIVIGPADLDDRSAAAPRCSPQQYPFQAINHGEEGQVVVAAQVDAAGAISAATLAVPSTSPHLNEAALEAMKFCRFAPQTAGTAGSAAGPRRVKLTVVYAFVGHDDKLPIGRVRIGIQPGLQGGS